MKTNKNNFIAFLSIVFVFVAVILSFGFVQDFTKVAVASETLEHSNENVVAPNCSGQCLDAQTASENNTELVLENAMTYYFSNLNINYAYNQVGTCSFVALEMLMNYFDNYYTDNIVANCHEVKAYSNTLNDIYSSDSPGSQAYFDSDYLRDSSIQNYYNRLVAASNTSLHAKLVNIAVNSNYINFSNDDYGLHIRFLYDIFVEYLQQYSFLQSVWQVNNQYNSNYRDVDSSLGITYSEKMRREVISIVKSGKPVIVDLRKYDDEQNLYTGHSVVAYDYDSNTDTLFYHFGWKGSSHVTAESKGYEYIYSYSHINYTGEHAHSDNYVINNVAMCSCKMPTHVHDKKFSLKNDDCHKAVCYCGYNELENHRFSIVIGRHGIEYKKCIDCNLTKLNDGGMVPSPLWNGSIQQIIIESLAM